MLHNKNLVLTAVLCASSLSNAHAKQGFLEDTAVGDAFHEVGQKLSPSAPRKTVNEFENRFIVEIAIPGLTKEQLKVVVDHPDNSNDARLVITATVKKELVYVDAHKKHEYKTVAQEGFEERIRLNHPVSIKDAYAELKNGILTIVLPKGTPLKKQSHTILIK